MRIGIVIPPKDKLPKPTPCPPATDCCQPNGPFLAVSRSYDPTHKLLVVAINCLAGEDEVVWRNPGGLPEGTVILNGGGIATADHVILIKTVNSNTGLVIRIGATVNGVDIGILEITLP